MAHNTFSHNSPLPWLCRRKPDAVAVLQGSADAPLLTGTVDFYQSRDGVYVVAQAQGLPRRGQRCSSPIFAMHIHTGGSCTGDGVDPFSDVDGHYNPEGCPHPAHAGDLPPLFGNRGLAWGCCLTNRFTVRDVLERTIILHAQADDFITQPGGDAGEKIACGTIRSVGRMGAGN